MANNSVESKTKAGDIDFASAIDRKANLKGKSDNKQTNNNKPNQNKKNKKNNTILIACIIFVAIIVVLVVGVIVWYKVGYNKTKDTFLYNTKINGVDVSKKNLEQAVASVEQNFEITGSFSLANQKGKVEKFDTKDIDFKTDIEQSVQSLYNGLEHKSWYNSLFSPTEYTIPVKTSYDDKKLHDLIVNHDWKEVEPTDAKIVQNEKGFEVTPEDNGNKLDKEKLYNFVKENIDEGNYNLDMSQSEAYILPKVTAKDLQEECDKLNNLYNVNITFDFDYAKETLEGKTFMDWISFKDDKIEVDHDKAMAYVEGLAEKYDTYKKDREFTTTNRGTITIPQGEGNYGWWLDQEKMVEQIGKLINDGKTVEVKPIYYVQPWANYEFSCNPEWRTSERDWDTKNYMEVDLSAQHFWYYKDGELQIESDIVSGYPSASRNTPGGVYKLWYKERAKTLRGSSDGVSYASYVDYWNYISLIGIGMHDASWQNGIFGGSRYKTSMGSHGCINMPFNTAKYVYDNIPLGTPVFMYW